MAATRPRLSPPTERANRESRHAGLDPHIHHSVEDDTPWAHQSPDDLSRIRHPVLVANGDQDKMVPSGNSVDLARRLPNAELVLYEDAGTGHISVSRSIREEGPGVLGVLRKRDFVRRQRALMCL